MPTIATRREILRIGSSSMLGLSLPVFLSTHAAAQAPARAKSVVLIFLGGGPSQLDTFDLKPDAPENIRGPFRPIATSAVGVQVCEHLPHLARQAHRFALVRSMSHNTPIHEIATHFVLTGIDAAPPGSTPYASRNNWPCYSAGLNFLRPRSDGLPNAVHLPYPAHTGQAWAGQDAGMLGGRYDPWQIRHDHDRSTLRVDDLSLSIDLTGPRVHDRQSLVGQLDQQRRQLTGYDQPREMSDQQRLAINLLTGSRIARAFQVEHEPPQLRDRYGKHMFGQSLLLTRRLLEAGVPLIQANMGTMNKWDTHYNNCKSLRNDLLPPLDIAVATFLEDLHVRGLLDETLVILTGEFGRTPRMGTETGGVNETPGDGRDHWAGAFTALFAGAGVQGGRLVGRSDRIAAFPITLPHRPSDLGATVYHALGIPAAAEVHDHLG